MAGFVGRIASPGNTKGFRVPLEACRLAVERRGSHWSVWQSDDQRVQIGFAGSAISTDLGVVSRPFVDTEKGIVVCVDGRIDNVVELAKALFVAPSFNRPSQAEIVAMVFRRWGVAGFRRLRGNFAMVVVDTRERQVFLVRDAMGRRPLYASTWHGARFFGSSVIGMASVAGVRPPFDPAAVSSWWGREYLSPDECLLDGCRPVMPGQVLKWSWESTKESRESCLPDIDAQPSYTPRRAVERLRELLTRSIQYAFEVSHCPVVFLSGGVDSTVLADFMWRLGGGRAVSMGGNRWLCPDSPRARFAAHHIGIPLRFVFPPGRDFLDTVAWAIDLQDEPLCMTHFLMLALMTRAAKEHGSAVLIGEGADRMFCGGHEPSYFIADATHDRNSSEDEIIAGPPGPSWISRVARHWGNHTLLGHTIPMMDRAVSEQGVELLTPFLDWDTVCFAKSLPPEIVFFDGSDKALVKAQLDNWPTEFVRRSKTNSTYRYRWLWLFQRYRGVRELISPDAAEVFGDQVPVRLRRSPSRWTSIDILRNFRAVWKLLVWSRFEQRLARACSAAPMASAVTSFCSQPFGGNGE